MQRLNSAYSGGGRPPFQSVHRYVRVYCSILLVLGVILSTSSVRLSAMAVIVSVVVWLSGVSGRRLLLGVFPIASLIAVLVLLALISGMKSSELRFAPIVGFAARCYLVFLTSSALLATTHYTDAIGALDALRVPAVFTAIAGSICRWFELVWREARNANTARVLRGGDAKSRPRQAADVARLSAHVITRSYLRAERVAAAMECRGFSGKLVRLPGEAVRGKDLAPLGIMAACLAAILVVLP